GPMRSDILRQNTLVHTLVTQCDDTDTPWLARDTQGETPCDRKASSALRSAWANAHPKARRGPRALTDCGLGLLARGLVSMRGNTVRSILFLVFILLLGAGAVYVDLPNTPGIHIGSYNNNLQVKQGLDLQGGIEITLQASCPSDQPKCDVAGLLPDALNAVQKRVAGGLGVNDSV